MNNMKYYDSKHSGAVAEQMLDDYVAGNLGGEGGAKVYHFDMLTAIQLGAIGQEVYDAIMDADIVFFTSDDNRVILSKYPYSSGGVKLVVSSVETDIDDPQRILVGAIVCTIGADLSVTAQMADSSIPTKTSQLINDSGFITAADLPPSGGLPTEVISLSSEVTLQEGKMLEIDSQTAVEGALTIKRPTTVNGSQGLLWGIRFFCGQTVPQLTFKLGPVPLWMNGELPQLEPNVLVEIIGAVTFDGYAIMSWAKYK